MVGGKHLDSDTTRSIIREQGGLKSPESYLIKSRRRVLEAFNKSGLAFQAKFEKV